MSLLFLLPLALLGQRATYRFKNGRFLSVDTVRLSCVIDFDSCYWTDSQAWGTAAICVIFPAGLCLSCCIVIESAPPHVMATILKHLHGAVESFTLIIIACVLYFLICFVPSSPHDHVCVDWLRRGRYKLSENHICPPLKE